jgi:murein DD-endopeptidase MepM/ murein hydrolase activator NlpD
MRVSTFLLLLTAASGCTRARPDVEPLTAAASGESRTAPASGENILEYLRSRELMVPVDGIRVSQVPDNFSAGRGGRAHNAHDLLAKRGTPVLAADDGRIIRLASNALGGITIYATDPAQRLVYYYAHLDSYAPGLKAGASIGKGELLGFVGSTGNATDTAPHLHFQVGQMTDIRRHWEGVPIDAREYFTLDGKRRR